jgi:NAD(P)-dependent dehydrogenase (short-subunit alcohol dehydrogenase family)
MDFTGKNALVTGASRGLGMGIALELAKQGANVIVNYVRSKEQAESVCNRLELLGVKSMPVQADVSNEQDVVRLFETIKEKCDTLDILVNNAGTTKSQDIFETSLDDWDRIIKTNLTSCFMCSKLAMELMRKQKSGRIVNISSIVGHRGALYGHVHYAATKSGIFGFTKTLARTAAPYGITVNAVAPGIIETELLLQTHGQEEIDKLSAQIPLGLGNVRDIGLAVTYLCGEGGRYITGATLDVNGGMYLR